MPALYPLLMLPIFDERPWGVRDLRPIYTKSSRSRSARAGSPGRTIASPTARSPDARSLIWRRNTAAIWSARRLYEDRFPLLVKFLFPGDKLSVQVHPDDEQAQQDGHPCGKTECWYVLRAEPGAQVALGLKPGATLDEFRRAIEATRAEELLNWVDVFAGDMMYVAAGTVHTIGGGMVLVETQQTSDTTYRLYDYGRGRELHMEEGLAAAKLRTNAGKVVRNGGVFRDVLVRSPFFQVEKIKLAGLLQAQTTPESPHIVVAVSGAGVVESPGMEPVSFATGDAVVVPASVGALHGASAVGAGDHAHVAARKRHSRAGNHPPAIGQRTITSIGQAGVPPWLLSKPVLKSSDHACRIRLLTCLLGTVRHNAERIRRCRV